MVQLLKLLLLGACLYASDEEYYAVSRTLASEVMNDRHAQVDFSNALTWYKQGHFIKALESIETLQTSTLPDGMLASVANLHGLIRLSLHETKQAIDLFTSALNASTDERFKKLVGLNLATALFDEQKVDAASSALARAMQLHITIDAKNQTKFRILQAKIARAHGERQASVLTFLLGDSCLLEPGMENFTADLFAEKDVRAVLEKLACDELLIVFDTLERAKEKNLSDTSDLKEALHRRFPSSLFIPRVDAVWEKLREDMKVRPGKIGILLPREGKFAKIGEKTLHAVQLAVKLWQKNHELAGTPIAIDLVIRHASDDPDQTIKALTDLVEEDHVIAVLGPLLSRGIDAIEKQVEKLKIPLISLSRKEPTTRGHFFFQAGLSPQLQVEPLIKFARTELQAHRFAIMSTDDKQSQETADLFWTEIEKQSGSVTGFETFQQKATDFQEKVDKLLGLYYTDARQDQIDALTQLRQTNNINKKTHRTASFFQLPAIVDFDALILISDSKTAGQIIPTFAYRDVDSISFLGINTWNTPDLAERIQSDRAFFTDILASTEFTPEPLQTFITQFTEFTGAVPGPLEAIAFDAAQIILASLPGNKTRDDLCNQLLNLNHFPGAASLYNYQDGRLTRSLHIFKPGKIKSGKKGIVSIDSST